ncbi:trypsin-like peptidase domain-containing protein [Candidatus Phytoplasma ziziphi]|nr:trypsin-like peptidase domain-containing protein [Candidatus Phytoplasma ziziphi]
MDSIVLSFINKKRFILFFLIFLLFLFFYYKYLFIKYQNQIIQNDYKKNQITFNLKDKVLEEKIQMIGDMQKKIQNIFDFEKDKPSFILKPHRFNKGDVVYAFTLDISSHMEPFQEGIVSKNYALSDNEYLPISIKGGNNKIFFNTKGEFIGISVPNQDPNIIINHIITSNSIFYFFKCQLNLEQSDLSSEKDIDIKNKYYFLLEVDNKKYKIFLNQEGWFLGFYNSSSKIDSKKNFLDYIFDKIALDKCQNNQVNIEKSNLQQKNNLENTKLNYPFDEDIQNLNKITFLIQVGSLMQNKFLSLGSGFIFCVKEIMENNEIFYDYYVLTNRHVLKQASKYSSIKIELFNIYFQQEAEMFGFINNQDVYDDIAILTFRDKNTKKFEEIKTILDKVLPKKKINVYQGEVVYSMGSQITQIKSKKLTFDNFNTLSQDKDLFLKPNIIWGFNLLKKGNIVDYNEKEISFDIQIDSGNSGGPVFNTHGEIIGINKSVIISDYVPDRISQCLNIEHVKQICNRIIELHKKNPIKKFFKILPEDYDYLENELNSFPPFNQNPNFLIKNKNNITITIEELLNYFRNKKIKSIISELIKEEKEIQLNIKLVVMFYKKEQIFSLNPKKEQIKIIYNEQKNNIIFEKKGPNNLNEIKIYNFDDIQLKEQHEPFISLELVYPHESNNDNMEINEKRKFDNLKKIKNSLIFWDQNEEISGNGIVFQKKSLPNNNFLYFVLSTYTNNKNKLLSLIEPIKNIFSNEIEITIFNNDNYQKEKGQINSFLLGRNNLILITFVSSNNYDIIPARSSKNLNLGEEIFFLTNNYNDNYFPQMFKGVVSYKTNDFVLCDSVFDLRNKNKIANPKFNFLYFDNEGNFIGVNNILEESNKLPHNFIKVALLKEKDIFDFLKIYKLKENLTLIFSCLFVLIVIFIVIIYSNYPIKRKF